MLLICPPPQATCHLSERPTRRLASPCDWTDNAGPPQTTGQGEPWLYLPTCQCAPPASPSRRRCEFAPTATHATRQLQSNPRPGRPTGQSCRLPAVPSDEPSIHTAAPATRRSTCSTDPYRPPHPTFQTNAEPRQTRLRRTDAFRSTTHTAARRQSDPSQSTARPQGQSAAPTGPPERLYAPTISTSPPTDCPLCPPAARATIPPRPDCATIRVPCGAVPDLPLRYARPRPYDVSALHITQLATHLARSSQPPQPTPNDASTPPTPNDSPARWPPEPAPTPRRSTIASRRRPD